MSAPQLQSRQSVWPNVAALLGYLLLALLMTWPLVTRLSGAIAGAGSDVWVHQWTFWWVKEALLNGLNPFYTTLLYYPEGVSLTSHNIAWFNIALWLPLQALLGSVTAYNLVFILVLALNGFAFYLLAKGETGARAASFLGGLIFAFWPYTFSHNDHPNMMTVFWVPLTMYFLLHTFRQGRLKDAVFTALCLAMIGITRWQLLVMSAPVILVYGVYLYFREGRPRPAGRTAVLLLLVAGLGALLMAPLGMPLVLDQLGRSGPEAVRIDEPEYIHTDLFAYFVPPDLYRAVWDEVPDPLPYPEWEPYQRIASGVFYVPFIGLATLAVALYGLWRQWSRTWFWLLVALGIMIMALGPVLVFNGQRYPGVPLPYRLISGSLLDALIRRPHRLNIFLSLPVAMMATWGMADIWTRVQERWGARRGRLYGSVVALSLAAVILWENPVPPIGFTDTPVPAWYKRLANEEGTFALLELPFHNRGFDKLYMYYQTFHGKPILVGHVSRLPQEAFGFLESVPFLEPFIASNFMWDVAAENWVDFADVDVTRQLAMLAQENVRYIVLNKPLIEEGFVERWRAWATFEPVYEDEEVLVYRTKPVAGDDFAITYPLVDGIGLIDTTLAPLEANQAGVLKADIRWATDETPAGDYEACFYLRDAQGTTAETMCALPVEGWPTSEWGAAAVARGVYVIPVAGDLPPGAYTVDMALAELGEQAPVGETVTLGEISVVPFEPQQTVSLCWEGGLCLRGYDLQQRADRLDVTLYWQAGGPAEEAYKRFAHLVEPQSGRVAAQSDAIPRDWTYAPDIWEADEIVLDALSLPLDEVAPGEYELRLGWYGVKDGQPLEACSDADCQEKGGVYHQLATVQVSK